MSDNRSPAEIEEQIEQERAELAGTLDTLQDRFSVEGVVNQVSDHLRSNGGEIARNMGETVKQNPLGVALVGAGLAWLMFGKGPSANRIANAAPDMSRRSGGSHSAHSNAGASYDTRPANYDPTPTTRPTPAMKGSHYRDDDPALDWYHDDLDDDDRDGTWDQVKDAAATGAAQARGGWQSTKETVADAAGSAKDSISGAAGTAKDKVSAAAGSAKDKAGSAADGAKDAAGSLSASGRDRLDTAKGGFRSARDGVADTAERTRRRLAQGTENMSAEARDRIVRARRAALRAKDASAVQAQRAAEKSAEAFDRQPLAFGALAFAVGAAAAATLPRTEKEDELLGAESDRLIRRAQRIYEEETQKAKGVAGAAVSEVKAAAQDAKADVDDKAQGDKTAVEAAVDKAKETGNRVADRAVKEAKSKDLGGSLSSSNS